MKCKSKQASQLQTENTHNHHRPASTCLVAIALYFKIKSPRQNLSDSPCPALRPTFNTHPITWETQQGQGREPHGANAQSMCREAELHGKGQRTHFHLSKINLQKTLFTHGMQVLCVFTSPLPQVLLWVCAKLPKKSTTNLLKLHVFF